MASDEKLDARSTQGCMLKCMLSAASRRLFQLFQAIREGYWRATRDGATSRCRRCGNRIDADVNAARTVGARRVSPLSSVFLSSADSPVHGAG